MPFTLSALFSGRSTSTSGGALARPDLKPITSVRAFVIALARQSLSHQHGRVHRGAAGIPRSRGECITGICQRRSRRRQRALPAQRRSTRADERQHRRCDQPCCTHYLLRDPAPPPLDETTAKPQLGGSRRGCPSEGRGHMPELVCRANLEPADRAWKCGWLGRQDSNLRMAAPKAAALPLGDAPAAPGARAYRRRARSGAKPASAQTIRFDPAVRIGGRAALDRDQSLAQRAGQLAGSADCRW